MDRLRAPLLLAALFLAACASSYQVVRLPLREADLYPLAQTRYGVSVAIDEITDEARGRRYFGANLETAGVVPVDVIVSNEGPDRIEVRPSDLLVSRGTQIIDPLPTGMVAALAEQGHWGLAARTRQDIGRYFKGVAFQRTVLAPGQTYQGVLFFPLPRRRRGSADFFSLLELFPQSRLQMVVGVRDLATRARARFGPYALSIPDDED